MSGDGQKPTKRHRLRVSPRIGAFSGVVVAIMTSFVCASIVWGILRPRYRATVVDASGELELNNVNNIEFTALFWCVAMTTVVALLITHQVYVRAIPYRGVAMMIWLALWCVIATIVFGYVGDVTTVVVHQIPSARSDVRVGDVVNYVPMLRMGLGAYAFPASVAVLYYWLLEICAPHAMGFTAASCDSDAISDDDRAGGDVPAGRGVAADDTSGHPDRGENSHTDNQSFSEGGVR